MATVAGTIYGNGCNYQLQYDILEQKPSDNTTKVRLYGVLNVTAGWVQMDVATKAWAWYSENRNLAHYYNNGSHTLVQGDYTFTHNEDGTLTKDIEFGIETSMIDGKQTVSITFPKINRAAKIDTFTGDSIRGNFAATYTKYSDSYRYKLRISVPNIKMLDTFDNYVSGTPVKLSQDSITYIKDRYSKTVTLGGVIETWSGNTQWDSQELMITCKVNSDAKIRVNGEWKDATPYVRVNGQWKEATPYMRVNGAWKEEI